MLRFFFLTVTAVLLVSVGYILLPRHTARPDAHLDTPTPAAAPDPTTFTVHQAPPATPPAPPPSAPAPAPASPPPSQAASVDLDAVMQRLRAAAAQHPDTTPPDAAPPQAAPAAVTQAPPPVITPTPVSPTPVSPIPVAPTPVAPILPPAPPPGSRWTNVTSQGARWRMTPAPEGFVIAIDIGGNRVASVHVAPAFTNLDQPGMNQRVDFLKQTILQNFPPESASYSFARDGSVSLDH